MRKLYLFLILSLLVFAGCSKDVHDDSYVPPKVDKVVFFYFAMDNNLTSFARENIVACRAGMEADGVRNGKIVAFCDFWGSKTKLVEYQLDRNGKCQEKVLIDYNENLDSSNPEVLTRAISDMKRLVDAKEYMLIVSSHGLGWAPSSMVGARSARYDGSPLIPSRSLFSRDIANDGSSNMNTDVFAATVPAGIFHTVLFDACFMAGIECVYPMRNKVDYFVGSLSETYVDGMPYRKLMGTLFSQTKSVKQRLAEMCEIYNEHYSVFAYKDSYGRDIKPGGNVALYDCSKVDAVAANMTNIITQLGSDAWSTTAGIQFFDNYSAKKFYDMKHAMSKIVGTSDLLSVELNKALDDMILCSYATPIVYDVAMTNFGGVSMFVPHSSTPQHNAAYKNTEWYKAVYKNSPLP